MRTAVRQMDLSARSYHPVHTLADLACEEDKQTQHLAETLHYRLRDLV